MIESEDETQSIDKIVNLIQSDVTKSNLLVELLILTEDDSKHLRISALLGLGDVFVSLLKQGLSCLIRETSKPDSELTSLDRYHIWINEKYIIFCEKLIESILLYQDNISLLHCFMNLVKYESIIIGKIKIFQVGNLIRLVLRSDLDTSLIAKNLELSYFIYSDILYDVILKIKSLLNEFPMVFTDVDIPNSIVNLLLAILRNIPKANEDIQNNLFISELSFSKQSNQFRKQYSELWLKFLSKEHPKKILNKVFSVLHSDIIPILSEPKLLFDFLTNVFNAGGKLSLSSLHSLFILIHKYNLDYPDFYTKLYSLLTPELINSKHSNNFFKLLDTFLTSTHLPLYIVASYTKRLARCALLSTPGIILLILPTIANLLIRHPICKFLLKSEFNLDNIGHDIRSGDPFIPEEIEPAKTRATESRLWEIETLRYHYSKPVVKLISKLFMKPLGKIEIQVNYVKNSNHRLLKKYLDKSLNEIKVKSIIRKEPHLVFRKNDLNENHSEK